MCPSVMIILLGFFTTRSHWPWPRDDWIFSGIKGGCESVSLCGAHFSVWSQNWQTDCSFAHRLWGGSDLGERRLFKEPPSLSSCWRLKSFSAATRPSQFPSVGLCKNSPWSFYVALCTQIEVSSGGTTVDQTTSREKLAAQDSKTKCSDHFLSLVPNIWTELTNQMNQIQIKL